MPYCRKCGAQLPEGAIYCPNCGAAVEMRSQLVLASWGDRFIAWLIDVIIIGIFLSFITWPGYLLIPYLPRWLPFVEFGFSNIVHFLYWMFMEGYGGQSIGKIVMRIKVTQLDGRAADLGQAAIESLGKAFLLPIDVLIGLIFYQEYKQRLFSYLSNTIVVRAAIR
jgi:uncharacterized RDD family membrane protein YckC